MYCWYMHVFTCVYSGLLLHANMGKHGCLYMFVYAYACLYDTLMFIKTLSCFQKCRIYM